MALALAGGRRGRRLRRAHGIADRPHDADIEALGRRAVAQPTDVRDSAQCDALIQRAVDEFGKLDIMLSNAGIGDMRGANAELWDVNDDDWHDTLDVNLSSAFYCARAASKLMAAQGRGGTIINLASGTAMRAYPMSFGYGAAKAGVIALTKSMSAMLITPQHPRQLHHPGIRHAGATRQRAGGDLRADARAATCRRSASATRGSWVRWRSSSRPTPRATSRARAS